MAVARCSAAPLALLDASAGTLSNGTSSPATRRTSAAKHSAGTSNPDAPPICDAPPATSPPPAHLRQQALYRRLQPCSPFDRASGWHPHLLTLLQPRPHYSHAPACACPPPATSPVHRGTVKLHSHSIKHSWRHKFTPQLYSSFRCVCEHSGPSP